MLFQTLIAEELIRARENYPKCHTITDLTTPLNHQFRQLLRELERPNHETRDLCITDRLTKIACLCQRAYEDFLEPS